MPGRARRALAATTAATALAAVPSAAQATQATRSAQATSSARASAHAVSRSLPAFRHAWSRITPRIARRMTYSWHAGCPVPLSRLRYVRVSYVGFDGKAHYGEIVVNAAVLTAVVDEFRDLYALRFRIHRMHLVDNYKGVDEASMQQDNTSAFNCRNVKGTHSWSMHAYGEAIDLNPIENPSLEKGKADPPQGAPYLWSRSTVRPGMVTASTRAVFARWGWGWGGGWSDRDLMHFSSNGR